MNRICKLGTWAYMDIWPFIFLWAD